MTRDTIYVQLNGREYAVTYCVSPHFGDYVQISTSWEQIALGQASFARPMREWRTRSVDPSGRLGKKVLAAAEALKAAAAKPIGQE